jgi:hypothetical protein
MRKVDELVVEQWAEDKLDEWLPGWTDYDDVLGGQYRIRRVGNHTYQVESQDGWIAGRFSVRVAAVRTGP